MWVKWNPIFVHLKIVLILMQDRWFVPNVPLAQKSFWTHLIVFQGDLDQAKAHFNPFGDSFNLGAR
jgi:hypothetical protein